MIKLNDVLEGLELVSDDAKYYYQKSSQSIYMITDEELRYVDEDTDEDDFDDLDDWQQDGINLAEELFYNKDDFIALPGKYEINDYRIMQNFSFSLTNEKNQRKLIQALQGRGAFRRFKDQVDFLGIEEEWYSYRNEEYRTIAKEWCEENNIDYTE